MKIKEKIFKIISEKSLELCLSDEEDEDEDEPELGFATPVRTPVSCSSKNRSKTMEAI